MYLYAVNVFVEKIHLHDTKIIMFIVTVAKHVVSLSNRASTYWKLEKKKESRAITIATPLILGICVMVGWQLSKQAIFWPVSSDHIVGSGLELMEVVFLFFKFTTDQVHPCE